MKDRIAASIDEHARLLEQVRTSMLDDIARVAAILIEALERGNKILLCGNGGSAADAQHIAAELTGRYLEKNRRPLPAIALTTDTSALTAVANDFGFDQIFSRQIRALGKSGDMLFAISTSGNSPNIVEACKAAREMNITSIALCGGDGGKLRTSAEISLVVPSKMTPHIQEMHIMIAHILCDLIDQHFTSR